MFVVSVKYKIIDEECPDTYAIFGPFKTANEGHEFIEGHGYDIEQDILEKTNLTPYDIIFGFTVDPFIQI